MAAKAKKPKAKTKVKKLKYTWVDPEGSTLITSKIKPEFRRILKHHLGTKTDKHGEYTVYDFTDPCAGVPFAAGVGAPVCNECALANAKSITPFMQPTGSDNPVVTIVLDGVAKTDDKNGYLASGGGILVLKRLIDAVSPDTGVTSDEVRFVPLTRCCNQTDKEISTKSAGQHCKIFFMQDLQKHPPKLIMPVGSVALGLLSHKSNVQDWAGRVLRWRGWPDDWLTNPSFALPRPYSSEDDRTVVGHPLFGEMPDGKRSIPVYPIQHPRLVYAQQSQVLKKLWHEEVATGLALAKEGHVIPDYNLSHYRLLVDPDAVIRELEFIIDHPGLLVSYDTETTGLRPWFGDRIVFMMFRYEHPDTGEPVAFGFPWDYGPSEYSEGSELQAFIPEIQPYVLDAICSCRMMGHNTAFDVLFTLISLSEMDDFRPVDHKGRVRKRWRQTMALLNDLASATEFDTWHMAYCRLQARASLGLEVMAYEYVPHLAGYDEEMQLLIKLLPEALHPDKGGHYAQCPKHLWESSFKPYVMGDVETVFEAKRVLDHELKQADVYKIPLAHPEHRGFFRKYRTPNRSWVYGKIMAPANQTLIKMMGRGAMIDQKVLSSLEDKMPKEIRELRDALRPLGDGDVEAWCKRQADEDPHKNDHEHPEKRWELDLERKDQLRAILFDVLKMPVQRLTPAGRKLYGEDQDRWREKIQAALSLADVKADALDENSKTVTAELHKYAAIDKFTLNKLAVDYPDIRPLQEYRRVHKLYGTYVRPLRNHQSIMDKKARTKTQHLCPDGCIHAQFMLTGTRGGRLSCRDPNLQQLPKKGDVKSMYISRFGEEGCLYASDLSQIELRLLAAASGDEEMVRAYHEDIDLHTLTTSRIFGTPYEHFSKDHMQWLAKKQRTEEAKELSLKRDIGKTVNFLTGYGGGAMGLQTVLAGRQIYRQVEDCEAIIKKFFDSYPAVRDLLGFYKAFIEENRCAVSLFGRVRQFNEVTSSDRQIKSKALRAGCNHLIQSTASDMLLVCLTMIEEMMREEGLDSILTLTVHDSLVVDARRSELPQIHDIAMTVLNDMPSVFKVAFGDDYDTSWMIVPFAGDSEVGLNYGKMRPIGSTLDVDWDAALDPRSGEK